MEIEPAIMRGPGSNEALMESIVFSPETDEERRVQAAFLQKVGLDSIRNSPSEKSYDLPDEVELSMDHVRENSAFGDALIDMSIDSGCIDESRHRSRQEVVRLLNAYFGLKKAKRGTILHNARTQLKRENPKANRILGLSIGANREHRPHTYEEVAKKIGCSPQTVRNTLQMLQYELPRIMGFNEGYQALCTAIDETLIAKRPEPINTALTEDDAEILRNGCTSLAGIIGQRNVDVFTARIGLDSTQPPPSQSKLATMEAGHGLSAGRIKVIEREVRIQLRNHLVVSDSLIPQGERMHLCLVNYILEMRTSESRELLSRILNSTKLSELSVHIDELEEGDRDVITHIAGMKNGIPMEHTAYAKQIGISEPGLTHREHLAWQALGDAMGIPYYRSMTTEKLRAAGKNQSASTVLTEEEIADVLKGLAKLEEDLRVVLEDRFGLNGDSKPMLQTDIGVKRGYTNKHAHQLVMRGLQVLDKKLKPSRTQAGSRSSRAGTMKFD